MENIRMKYSDWEKATTDRLSRNWLGGLRNLPEGGTYDSALMSSLLQDQLLKMVEGGENWNDLANWRGSGQGEDPSIQWSRQFTKADWDKYNANNRIGDLQRELMAATRGRGRNPDGTVDVWSDGDTTGFFDAITDKEFLSVPLTFAAMATGGNALFGPGGIASGISGAGAAGSGAASGAAGLADAAALESGLAAYTPSYLSGPGASLSNILADGSNVADLLSETGESLVDVNGYLETTTRFTPEQLSQFANDAVNTVGNNQTLADGSQLSDLLQQTGEYNIPWDQLEGGFNSAISNAPWWSSLPTGLQNLVQSIPGVMNQAGAQAARAVGTAAAGTAAGAGGVGNVVSNLLGNGQQGDYEFPWDRVLGSILGYLGSRGNMDFQEDMIQELIDSDLWRQEQPKYFQPLHDTVTRGIGGTPYGDAITRSVNSNMASRGYNMSGNEMHELGRSLNEGTNQRIAAVAPLAMGRPSHNMSGALPGLANTYQNGIGNLGYGLQSIFNGNQPTSAQQNQGIPRNRTLTDVLL